MKKYIPLLFFFFIQQFSFGQTVFTVNKYAVRQSASNLIYGTAVNYAGFTDTLKLDIYTPINDSNCHRPLFVMIHGGAWVAGDKGEASVISTCKEMAKKGYVAASINYRLGTHKAAFYVPYAVCSGTVFPVCAQIADSSEVLRAIFRGMQDAKGAIRFLKMRNGVDSSDINNVFVGGESAGGFIALNVAYMNLASEKPADAFALADAPTPDSDLANCNPTGATFTRPDLGSVDGDLNTGIYNADVKGVGNFFGAILNLQLISGTNNPVIYSFHQTTDVIVSPYHLPPLNRLSWDCLYNICQPYYSYPYAFGSSSIETYLTGLGTAAPAHSLDLVGTSAGTADCLISPPGHSVDNNVLRSQHMADLFSGAISSSNKNCTDGIFDLKNQKSLSLYPNIISGNEAIHIYLSEKNNQAVYLQVTDVNGKIILEKTSSTNQIEFNLPNEVANGIYIVRLKTSVGIKVAKLVKE